jgi:hypothetical protein
MAASSKRMGNLSSTFEKADSAYSICVSAPPLHGQKKQLTLLSHCKLSFTGINMLMALKMAKIYLFMSSTAQSSSLDSTFKCFFSRFIEADFFGI